MAERHGCRQAEEGQGRRCSLVLGYGRVQGVLWAAGGLHLAERSVLARSGEKRSDYGGRELERRLSVEEKKGREESAQAGETVAAASHDDVKDRARDRGARHSVAGAGARTGREWTRHGRSRATCCSRDGAALRDRGMPSREMGKEPIERVTERVSGEGELS